MLNQRKLRMQTSTLKQVFLFIIILIAIATKADNETIDSLKSTLNNKDSKTEQAILKQLADQLIAKQDKEGLHYAHLSLHMAKRLNLQKELAQSQIMLGYYYVMRDQLDSARFYFSNALHNARELNEAHFQLNIINGLAETYFNLMEYDSAHLLLNEGLKLTIHEKNEEYRAMIYNGLAKLLSREGQFDTAVALYYKARNIYQKVGDSADEAHTLNSMAATIMESGQAEMARPILEEAVALSRHLSDKSIYSNCLTNLAICYKKIGLLQQAEEMYLELLTLNRNNIQAMAINYMNIGTLYIKQEKYKKASLYLDSSLAICKENKIAYGILLHAYHKGLMFYDMKEYDSATPLLKKAYQLAQPFRLLKEQSKIQDKLYKIYKDLGNIDSALFYFESYSTLRDSLHNKDVRQKITELEQKFEQEKNLKQIAELNKLNFEIKSNQRILVLGALIIILFLITLFLYRIFRQRNRVLQIRLVEKEKEALEVELKTREKELTINAMHMIRTNDIALNVAKRLKLISRRVSAQNRELLAETVNELEVNAPAEIWNEFETRFKNIHQGFYKKLNEKHPGLTPTEIKICSFIRLNMTSKDIAILTNRSVRTIESTRNGIRKKLALEQCDSLTKYLLSI